jgi:hypothetical protein
MSNENSRSVPEHIPRLSEVLRGNATSAASSGATSRSSRPSPTRAASSNNTLSPPWKAGYYTSLKTQKRIKEAALSGQTAGQAGRVLQTFLDTPPERCNPANLVCALTLSAKLIGRQPMSSQFQSYFYQTTSILQHMLKDQSALSARQLCNVIWAIAKHYARNHRLLPLPHEQLVLSSQTAMGRAERWDLRQDGDDPAKRLDETIDAIAQKLAFLLEEDSSVAKEGELCMATWAYGVLRPRIRPPGWKLGPQTSQYGGETATETTPDFIKFEKWTSQSSEVEEEENTDTPSATDKLFDSVAFALIKRDGGRGGLRLQKLKWREIANVAWAYASHGGSSTASAQDLLNGIADEAAYRLRANEDDQVSSRDIAQVVWSLGALQCDNFRLADSLVVLIDAVAETSCNGSDKGRPFQQWSCADLVQVVLSLAHARINELPLLCKLYEEASIRLKHDGDEQTSNVNRKAFRPWEISVLLWAQARLYLKSPQGSVFDTFAMNAAKSISILARKTGSLAELGIGAQEGANIAWSLTVLESAANPQGTHVISMIFDEAAVSCKEDRILHLEHAHQLWQALFLLEEESPQAVNGVAPWFREYLHNKWVAEKARTKMSSARHRSLSQALDLMGVAHKNEHDEDIDVAIVLKPNASWSHQTVGDNHDQVVKVAVEFDGPNHFTRQQEAVVEGTKAPYPRTLGHTVLKYRLLKKQGWNVVRVPYYEFDKIPFWASMERQRYLQRLLKTHGNLKFSEMDISEYIIQNPNRKSRFD